MTMRSTALLDTQIDNGHDFLASIYRRWDKPLTCKQLDLQLYSSVKICKDGFDGKFVTSNLRTQFTRFEEKLRHALPSSCSKI